MTIRTAFEHSEPRDRFPLGKAATALIRTKRHGPSSRNLAAGQARSRPTRGGIVGLLAVGLLSSCASGARLSVPLATVPNRQLSIWSIHATDIGEQILVSGLVRRPALHRGPLWGHLHIEAKMADGGAPVTAGTRWSTIAPRGSRTGRFSARLPIADPSRIVAITAGYVPDRHRDGR